VSGFRVWCLGTPSLDVHSSACEQGKPSFRRNLDLKLNAFRASEDQRAYLQSKVAKHKADIVAARHGKDYVEANLKRLTDTSFEEAEEMKRLNVATELEERMALQRAELEVRRVEGV